MTKARVFVDTNVILEAFRTNCDHYRAGWLDEIKLKVRFGMIP